ncbi:MAG: MBL fold metallo-hydrolase [Prevotella sp.]|nr:MBL fold metallo-hydrolase [Prevotella sp.]
MKTKTLLMALLLCMTAWAQAAQKQDTFTTPGGKTVTINHIKHASIHIEYEGRNIYIDPVGNLEPRTDFSLYPKANILLITHEHFDHYDQLTIPQLCTPATAVYTNKSVNGKIHRGIALSNGDSIVYAQDIKIWAVPAYNTTEGREQFHPKGRDNGYVLSLDGLRIYIAGDTEDIPEMDDLKDIDIAFLPCNQPYTMTIDQLVRAAKVIQPKVLFPYHYSETPVNQVRIRLNGSGINVKIRDYK